MLFLKKSRAPLPPEPGKPARFDDERDGAAARFPFTASLKKGVRRIRENAHNRLLIRRDADPSKPAGRARRDPVIVFCVSLVFVLVFQGQRGLWESDEGRYTNIALQMLESGDFITPRCNSEKVHFTKPPLTYWAIAAGIALLGHNELGARLPNAVAFAFTTLLIFLVARRMFPERALLAPLVYATSLFPFVAANIITTDTLLTMWEAAAVYGFVAWWTDHDDMCAYQCLMWTAFGLAFLTKGPPGLLPLLAIAAFLLLRGGPGALRRLFRLRGIVLLLLVGTGWYLVVAGRNRGLLSYFFFYEFIDRIASGIHHRNSEWYKPLVVYLPVLLLGAVPWVFLVSRRIVSRAGKLVSCSWYRQRLAHEPWLVFLLLWLFLPLVVFFLSKSRLPLYILPVFTPLSLLLAAGLKRLRPTAVNLTLLALWCLVLLGVKLGASRWPREKDNRKLARAITRSVSVMPEEIVFAWTKPWWGLTLYLHGEVEGVWEVGHKSLSSYPVGRKDEPLREELTDGESRSLFITKKKHQRDLVQTATGVGLRLRAVGDYRKWVFLEPVEHKPTP